MKCVPRSPRISLTMLALIFVMQAVWPQTGLAEPAFSANADRTCAQLADELAHAEDQVQALEATARQRVGNNAIALGLSAAMFWPALLMLRFDGSDERALQQLRSDIEALQMHGRAQRCGDLSLLPAHEQAAFPLQPGDVLVYAERTASTSSTAEFQWRLDTLTRRRVGFTVLDSAGSSPGEWIQDRAGNVVVPLAGAATAYWRNLLLRPLQPGLTVSGEIMGLGGATVSVRGIVVGVSVKTPFARAFDAAVLELTGEVAPSSPPTSVSGVMVVDQGSGLLLRLELRSSDPAFDFERKLLRIQSSGP